MIIKFPEGGRRLKHKMISILSLAEAEEALKKADDPEVKSDLEAAIRLQIKGKVTVALNTALRI